MSSPSRVETLGVPWVNPSLRRSLTFRARFLADGEAAHDLDGARGEGVAGAPRR